MKLLIIVPFLLLVIQGFGQNYLANIQELSIRDGLSDRFTHSVLRDRDGFIWIGTAFGLNRYDGHSFKSYTSIRDSIADVPIKKMLQDDQGKIWLCNVVLPNPPDVFKHIEIFDPVTETVLPFEAIVKGYPDLARERISELYADQNQVIYLGTVDGKLYQYQNQELQIFPYTFPKQKIDRVWSQDSIVWVRMKNLLLQLTIDGKLINQRKLTELSELMGTDSLGQLWWWEDLNDTIYIKHLDKNDQIVSKVYPNIELMKGHALHARYNALKINPNDNTIWCETYTKLNVVHPEKGLIYSLDKRNLEPNSNYKGYPSTFSQVYIDHQNLAWVCTSTGVHKIMLASNSFKNYTPNCSTRGIIEMVDSSTLILSYQGIKQVKDSLIKDHWLSNDIQGKGFCIIKDRNKKSFWIGTVNHQLYSIKENQETYRQEKIDLLQLLDTQSISIKELSVISMLDYKGYLWLGTHKGFFRYAVNDTELIPSPLIEPNSPLNSATIHALYSNAEGLWIVSSKGLFLYDTAKGVLEEWSTRSKQQLPFDVLYHLHEDKAGIFWLATKGGGMIRLNRTKNSWQQFTTQEGLAHNVIYAIYEDDFGYLWISSNYGLMRFNKRTHLINIYLPKDGISHEEFNRGSHYQAEDGALYFGGLNGIVKFYPKDFVNQKNLTAQLQITNFEQFDGKTGDLLNKTKDLLNSNKIVLAPEDKFFVLDFALLDFRKPSNNKYAYKIEGYDDKWSYVNVPKIRINGLPAGNYTLVLKGQGYKGLWTENQLKIRLIVLLPFYKKWWFILTVIVCLITGISSYLRWRVLRFHQREELLQQEVIRRTVQIEEDKKTIEEQATKLQHLDEVKSRFFANISHELRTPLTLILGPIQQITAKDFEDNIDKIQKILQTTKRNGLHLQQLIEEILELSKLESNKLDLIEEEVAFYSFVKQLCSPFETQAELLKIDFQVNYELEEQLTIKIDKQKFAKIFNNLLSNALKFTNEEESITIDLKATNQQLFIEVMDTGSGIPMDDLPYIFDRYYQSKQPNMSIQGGTGIGLALAQELTSFLGGKLSVKSEWEVGSTFQLVLPLKIITRSQDKNIVDETIVEEPIAKPIVTDKMKHILIVEDHPDMCAYIGEILKPFYCVHYSENGALALDYLHGTSQLPDLIISDLMMPIMDGFQLLQNLKTTTTYANIPMIMLTARANYQNKLEALTLGVDDYLIKPFGEQELLIRIQNLLKRTQQQKEEEEGGTTEVVESIDTKWLLTIKTIVNRELKNNQLNINLLVTELYISERQLHRRIKKLTGLTPNKYIREIKLQIARELLEKRMYATVSEYAYHIGFTNVSYFSQLYLDRFGKKPMEYLAESNKF